MRLTKKEPGTLLAFLLREMDGTPAVRVPVTLWKQCIGPVETKVAVLFDQQTGFLYIKPSASGRVVPKLCKRQKVSVPIKLVEGMDKRLNRVLRVIPPDPSKQELVINFGLCE